MNSSSFPIAVIGAGPIGLAAAAHLSERGIPFVVFEAGDDVAASVREWAHVQLFSPWSYNIDPAARRLLESNGWIAPDVDEHPTGGELIEHYLEPLALPAKVEQRKEDGRFVYHIEQAAGIRLGAGGPTFSIESLNGDLRIRKGN